MEEKNLKKKLSTILPHLNERQRRILLAAESQAIGHRGIAVIARVAKVSRPTIYKGLGELKEGRIKEAEAEAEAERIRKPGGGRKKLREKNPKLIEDLESLVDPVTRGDPMSPLRWTCKSVRQLARALAEKGYKISYQVVSELLHEAGYSLQSNVKKLEGGSHEDRDAQFTYINEKVKEYLYKGSPIVSVDAKKKELVGRYKNNGREWQPKGQSEEVNTYDFINAEVGKALPYGIYDIGRNIGWVNVGCDHDTASFAVESLRRWWQSMGYREYQNAKELLICADCGGSNGYRARLWKYELQRFAGDAGLSITVCHFPPGTSKWNKIERRFFSHISMNWRGRPLIDHEVIVQLISSTTTQKGLKVYAKLDKSRYPTKVKISDQEMASINLKRHDFHGEWNYTICP